MPLVTVVIPYHNEPEEFVRECLNSLLSQTFGSFEAIIVDDASDRNNLSAVVDELNDTRFKVIRRAENRGLAAARNTGIRAARAELLALLDSDDRLDPSFLQEAYGALQSHPEADWAVVDWQLFGTREDVWSFPIDRSLNCPAHFLFVGPGALMRRSVWESVGGYPEDEALRGGGEDWDFWISAAEHRLQVVRVARPLYQYRIHPRAMTFTTSQYNDHRIRKAIYRRHQAAFLTMGLDCPRCPTPRARVTRFLAEGLAVSSLASLRTGHRARAIALAGRALLLAPRNAAYRRHFVRVVLPRRLRTLVRRTLRRDIKPGPGPKFPPAAEAAFEAEHAENARKGHPDQGALDIADEKRP